MKAFITGSHAYGKPTEDSDVDLVVRVDEQTRSDLVCLLHQGKSSSEKDYTDGVLQFKVATLNLILCVSDEQYAAWAIGTEQLKAIRPVTRDFAVETFKRLFGAIPKLEAPKEPPQLLARNP